MERRERSIRAVFGTSARATLEPTAEHFVAAGNFSLWSAVAPVMSIDLSANPLLVTR